MLRQPLLLLALLAVSAFAAPAHLLEEPCINDGKKVPCEKKQIDDELPAKVEWKKYDEKRLEPCPDEAVQEDTGCEVYEDAATTVDPIATLAPVPQTTTAAPVVLEYTCRDGEIRYKDSCYYVERVAKASVSEAENKCFERKSTLFVANDLDEYKNVIESHAPKNDFTWIGLYKKDESSEPTFHMDGINYKDLNWLNKADKNSINSNNGWTSSSQCAAVFNPDVGKYDFYYPCTYSFYYVCERNLLAGTDTPKKFF